MSKHTPGPWQQHGSHIYGRDPERRMIGVFQNPTDRDDGQMQANIDLAIAAPDLLEALIYAVDEICNHPDGHHAQFTIAQRLMKAAIAKATGAAS